MRNRNSPRGGIRAHIECIDFYRRLERVEMPELIDPKKTLKIKAKFFFISRYKSLFSSIRSKLQRKYI